MFSKNVSKTCWSDVVLTVAYFINHMAFKILDSKVPINLMKTFFPHVHLLGSLPMFLKGISEVHFKARLRAKHSKNTLKLDSQKACASKVQVYLRHASNMPSTCRSMKHKPSRCCIDD